MLKSDYFCWDCVEFIAHEKPCNLFKKSKHKKFPMQGVVAYLDRGEVIQLTCLGFEENERAKEIRKRHGN